MSANKLFLVRGLPGAGKSTFVKHLGDCVHLEADMYFLKNGEYVFNKDELKDAHLWCQNSCYVALSFGKKNVVVSNTFTQEWEMKPYFEMAEKMGVEVTVLVVENYHGGKSIHDVPQQTMDAMEKRFTLKLK